LQAGVVENRRRRIPDLEEEVEEGAWWVCDALPGDCFTESPAHLWRDVLRRQGMPVALLATFPADLANN
jgi:putative transcriptional regulator